LKGQTRDPNTLRAQYLENYLSYRLQIWYAALYRECRAGAQIIFPESGRSRGHVTPTIFGSTVGYPSDSLASYYPRDAMLTRVIAIATCLSVHLSVTRRYYVKTKKVSVMISSPSGSPTILVFWCQISSRHSKGFPPSGTSNKGGRVTSLVFNLWAWISQKR